jgi:hypothetical protein
VFEVQSQPFIPLPTTTMGFLAKLIAVSLIGLLHLSEVSAVGTPFGLGAATTGGGSATPATPSSLTELASWLSDSTARVILLDKVFDFTNSEGTITGPGCKPWSCTPNPQVCYYFHRLHISSSRNLKTAEACNRRWHWMYVVLHFLIQEL